MPSSYRFPLLAALSTGAVAAIAFSSRAPLVAQDTTPTYAKDVAPIINANCTGCHRPGGLGPFSLMDYDSVRANASDIKDAVKSGYMPPWHAEGPRDVFSNDRRLSDLDRLTILRWLETGTKPGDLKKAPKKPVYATGWELGTPDTIVTMAEDFTVPASGTVDYQYFEVPTNFTEDKWVDAIEFMPGAREVVHHVLVYARVPQPSQGQVTTAASATAAPAPGAASAARPKPLFVNQPHYETPPDPPRQPGDKHPPPRQLGTLIGGTAPGTNVMYFPKGTAMRLRKGTVLTFQMHYTAHGHEMNDRTSVGFRYAKEAPAEEMRTSAFINGAFTLPAGKKDVDVTAVLEPTEPVKIFGLLPHTHLRGTRWKYELQMPDGSKKLVLDVPRYDFNWQTYYFFKEPLEIPAGAKLVSTAWYDNSAENPHNPNAKIDVKWGDQTWEEMQYTGFLYTVPSRRLKTGP